MNPTTNTNPKLSDYLYIFFKWRYFILINFFIVSLVTIGITFLIPVQYKATSVVMAPSNNQFGLGGLASLLGGGGSRGNTANLAARLIGGTTSDQDVLLGLLNSRTSIMNAIHKFELIDYYEIDDKNMDKAVKAFTNDLSFGPNEFGMIEISVINEDPQKAADITNYFVTLLDSMHIDLNIQQAKNNRTFIEKRYLLNLEDLKKAEDSLYKFQRRFGIIALPEQIEVSVKAAAEIEAQLMAREIAGHMIKLTFGENSPQYQGVLVEIDLLKERVENLQGKSNIRNTSNVMFPFDKFPDISQQYIRSFRELEIQQSILEVLLPLYEQAKIEEQKSIPTIYQVDKAQAPELKDSPRRALIVIIVTFLALSFFLVFVFVGERLQNLTNFSNPLQQSGSNFIRKISKFYKVS